MMNVVQPTIVLRQRSVGLPLLFALLTYALPTYYFNWVCDDAFISFRYAKHLAEGEGLRFNIGEDPPVEGFSNLLWVLMLAPFEAAGWPPAVWSRVISIACGVLLIWRLVRYLQRRTECPTGVMLAAGLFLVTLPPIAVWSTSGLATMPFALLFFLAFERLLPDSRRVGGGVAGAYCGLMILLRADGFVWAAVLIALAAVRALGSRDRSALTPLLICSVIAIATLAGLSGFRVWYFHEMVPNTVYAKAGFSWLTLERGLKYVGNFFLTFPHLALIIGGGLWAARRHRARFPSAPYAGLIAVVVIAYSVVVGGDFMTMGRFLVLALPIVSILFAVLLQAEARRKGRGRALGWVLGAILLSLLPVFDVHVVPRSIRERTHFRWNTRQFESELAQWQGERDRVETWTEIGLALRDCARRGETLPGAGVGAVGYHCELVILDRVGLVTPEVARLAAPRRRLSPGHDKMVPLEYFLGQRPTYIDAIIIPRMPRRELSSFLRGYSRHQSGKPDQIKTEYAPLAIPVGAESASAPDKWLILFKRKDLIEPAERRFVVPIVQMPPRKRGDPLTRLIA